VIMHLPGSPGFQATLDQLCEALQVRLTGMDTAFLCLDRDVSPIHLAAAPAVQRYGERCPTSGGDGGVAGMARRPRRSRRGFDSSSIHPGEPAGQIEQP
jgi:hypothetical protein